MKNTAFQESEATSEIKKIASFIYKATIADLPKEENRHFSFYKAMAQKVTLLDSMFVELELSPGNTLTGPELTPETMAKPASVDTQGKFAHSSDHQENNVTANLLVSKP